MQIDFKNGFALFAILTAALVAHVLVLESIENMKRPYELRAMMQQSPQTWSNGQ